MRTFAAVALVAVAAAAVAAAPADDAARSTRRPLIADRTPAAPGAARADAAPAVRSATAAAPPAPPLTSFTGLDVTQSVGVNPADVQIAAGPGTVVEAVNTSIGMWNTTSPTPAIVRRQTLGAFFSTPDASRVSDQMTDPRVIFDGVSGRFFAVAFDVSRLERVLAVSQGTDPSAGWNVYALPSTGCTDQPRLGVSDAVVVVTDDLFTTCRGSGFFLGGEVTVLSKRDLLAGVPSPQQQRLGPDRHFGAITPVQSLSPAPVQYLVAINDAGTGVSVARVESATQSSLPLVIVPLASRIVPPGEAPQSGSAVAVDAGDNRVQNAMWENDHLWLAAGARCGAVTCARVIELATPQPRVLVDRELALPNARSLLYPAVVPDRFGNVTISFEYSSVSDFPTLAYAYMRPDGEFSTAAEVVRGTAPNTSRRFGDYSGAARDPSDPTKLWVAGEIGAAINGTTLAWNTGIGAVRVPPQPPAVRATRVAGARVTAEVFAEGATTKVSLDVGGKAIPVATVGGEARAQVVSASPKLAPGQTVRAHVVATNANGTGTGTDVTLRAPAGAPTVVYPRAAVTRAGATATLRAVVAPRGAATTVTFEYGTTRAYGRRATVRVGNVAGSRTVSVHVARLVGGTTYHFRAVATNARGRVAGADRTFRA